jgi:hypothetical protein
MHNQGQVITLTGKVIGYFEYDTVTDICLTKIWPTKEQLLQHWRQGHKAKCTCNRAPTDVWLYELNYVPGSYAPGKVCLPCEAIVDGTEFWDLDEPWPKDGHPMGLPEDDS